MVKLDADSEEALVRRILKSGLRDRLDTQVAAGRRILIDRYRTWADKYAVTLGDLETQRAHAADRLNGYLRDLGYES